MKNIFKLLPIFIALLIFSYNSKSQSSTRPWLIGFGANAIDYNAEDSISDLFQTENWNFAPAVGHLTISKCLNSSLALDLQLGAARVTTLNEGVTIGGKGFGNGRLALRYKFDNGYMIKENATIAPYIFILAGASTLTDDGVRPNFGGGGGLNIWFWKDFGGYVQSSYNYATDDQSYLEHSLGLVVRFGQKDTDGDGISDEDDGCPTEAGPASTNGCPDKDGDGVADKMDACPDVAGLAALSGCPDADGDGIADKDDKCPAEKGSKELMGCPDRDGDGIADKDDQCPDQKGSKEYQGCPDTDGDGIPDKTDACPTQKGTAALNGCPDKDGDGVADNKDRCPDQAGPASNGGCPVPLKEEIEKLKVAAQAIQFETGSDKIRTNSFITLNSIVEIMNKYPQTNWDIQGHTDDVGKDEYNHDLSHRRAASVKNYFISKGVTADRLQSEGFGETKPIADNKTAAGRAQNRRTEIHLIEKQ